MENVILVIHLILACGLIGIVLLQRSEGAALLSGGGQTGGRGQVSGIQKLTWLLAAAFIATSIALTIVAAANSQGASVVDRPGAEQPAAPSEEPAAPADGLGDNLLPPPVESAPATEPPVRGD